NFEQPDAAAIAVNRVFQPDGRPSEILGRLTANGRVYVINKNGIVFGSGAQVNVGGLVASSLDITPDALNGLASAAVEGLPAFSAFVDADGAVVSGPIEVAAGAKLEAPSGQIFLFAPRIDNSGTISAPDGQVIAAAGERIYLAVASGDEA